MSVTSFWFLVLVITGTLVFYVIPKKLQWMELLLLSLVFYYFAATPITILYFVIFTGIAYCTGFVGKYYKSKDTHSRIPYRVTILSIILIVFIWFLVKGRGIWVPIAVRTIGKISPNFLNGIYGTEMVAALGMGYFTLQTLGYIIDCYWGNIEPQKNPLKLLLFLVYFPQLTTGPISRYAHLESLYEPHDFHYENICMGAQRILWGFFKKIVIAERVGMIVSGILADQANYHGFYSWLVVLLYPLQMYADFSGCMDIVLGVSELFGIKLAENFNNPFFATTSQEFWQRWHITLGTWAKDYVLYPLLKSEPMIRFGRFNRKKFGKTVGNYLQNCVGMFCLWMVMGIWHGGYRYVLGVSLWYWIILMLGNLCAPLLEKVTRVLEMKTQSFSWHLFQSVRTYLIYAIGATFFLCGIGGGLSLLKDCTRVFTVEKYANPWIFFDSSILNLGIEYRDINLLVIGVVALLIVAILRERHGYARLWIAKQSVGFRWILWLCVTIVVVVYGKYGPNFDPNAFIYAGF